MELSEVTSMLLEEITNGPVFENSNFECKSTLDRKDVTGWLKTVAGFANAEGGCIYIGVEDKTNKLIGFSRNDADAERNYFNNQVNEHLSPRPETKTSFIPYQIRDKERFIIRVDVKVSDIRPVILKMNGVPAIYMRRDGFTNGATYEEIIDMSISSKKTQYDVLTSNIPYSRDNFKDLLEFYSVHNSGACLTDKALKAINFFDENAMLTNGALLFEDGYAGGKTAIKCSVFSGFNKGSERIVSVNTFSGNLTGGIEYAVNFVKQRMNHSFVKLPSGRINIDAFPERALFEGVVNAIAHRDYYLDGTQIQIDMFRDRLEISSPGSFYKGGKISKTYDLSSVISKRRNEIISGILVKCNVMEASGTGFDKITEDYKNADDAHRPYIFSTSDHFTLVLPDLTYTDGVSTEGLAIEYPPVTDGTDYDERILSFCYGRSHSAAEIAKHLGINDSSYFRKRIIENLVAGEYLIKTKNSRTYYYIANKDLVRPA